MKLHEYQKRIVTFLQQHKNAILSVDMGLGKTIAVLTFLQQLQPKNVLIVAPKRVAETVWAQEAEKWCLPIAQMFTRCIGTKAKRHAAMTDETKPYKIVSRDNIKDLDTAKVWDVVVFDELTSFKTIDSARTEKALQIQARRKIGLTGTFLANGAIDVYGQAAVCGLNRWGLNFYQWRATFFRDVLKGSGLAFSKWTLSQPLEKVLQPIQSDIFTLTAADWLEIPQVTEQVMPCELSAQTMSAIQELDAFLSTEIDGEIYAINDKQKFAKLQTLCNGFVYDENGAALRTKRSDKLEAVADFVAEMVEQGEHVLLFYAYRDEALWLHEMLTAKRCRVASVKAPNFLERWNAGEIDVLFAHPASAGHGLNLQHGGRVIVWSTLTYNYELFAQGNARLARQGQQKGVRIFYFVAKDTVEERIIKALRTKDKEQRVFLDLTKQ